MRVLHVSNLSAPRCGIQNFGVQVSTALRRAGCEVVDWDGCYEKLYEKPYLPADAADFDVIHVNWHPVTINHLNPSHFPSGPILSVYLNDLPPWSSCPLFDRAQVKFAAEDFPGCVTLPYPVADWVFDLPDPPEEFTVGWSGVRGDGAELLLQVCAELDYATNAPDGVWRSFEDEVRRQARSTVNVLWYHEARGISGGASQAAAAKRPLLLNASPMFAHLWPYEDELYLSKAVTVPFDRGLRPLLRSIAEDFDNGTLKRPNRLLGGLSWTRAAKTMWAAWEAA